MIALLGGPFNGMYVDQDVPPAGTRLMVDGTLYVVGRDGVAQVGTERETLRGYVPVQGKALAG